MPNTFSTSSSSSPIKTFQVDALSVRVYNSSNELAQDAACLAQNYLQSLIAQQGTASIILATGNSQIQFLEALKSCESLDWSRITCFHLDEYLGIAADHPASFRRYLHDRIEKSVNPRQFHYIEGDTTEPLAECDRYTKLLTAQPIDLCCLGLGGNGHLAFNEPSVADFKDSHCVKLVKLDESTRQHQVEGKYFPNLESVPQYAFTLTIPAICSAKKILCLAPSESKRHAVDTMLQGAIGSEFPASVLRKQAQAALFLDVNSFPASMTND